MCIPSLKTLKKLMCIQNRPQSFLPSDFCIISTKIDFISHVHSWAKITGKAG